MALVALMGWLPARRRGALDKTMDDRTSRTELPKQRAHRVARATALSIADRAELDPTEMRAALDGPLTVRSGHTAKHGMLLTNLSDRDISVKTNGHLIATIIDDAGQPVG